MTVIHGIESEEIRKRRSETNLAILHNEPLEEKLHTIMVLSNPCEYKRRWKLAKEFTKRMESNREVILYIVELVYKDQTFHITDAKNPRHLQLRTEIPLWHKENMINIGIKKLLPKDWKCVAWIDADIEFENMDWVEHTLKILNGSKDIVQLFSHCIDMNHEEEAMNIFQGFGYQYDTGKKYFSKGINFWHPGFAWAMTRRMYEKIQGMYDASILGAGDHQLALAIVGSEKMIYPGISEGYKKSLLEFIHRAKNFRLGYVPGVIRHYYHGSKKNRKYMERWQVLIRHKYNPIEHVLYDEQGILIPSENCPKEMLEDIMNYFRERKEDE